jgi:repressor of nif and glnA expression
MKLIGLDLFLKKMLLRRYFGDLNRFYMKFSINLDIELTEDELKWIKDKFLPNRRTYNIIFEKIENKSYSTNIKIQVVKSLVEKNIIIVDSLSNSTLTQIGHKILDSFDRDKKISDLLDGTNGIES